MGQYHFAYNKSKKEKIRGLSIGCGSKLMEQIGFEKSMSDAVYLLLANSNGRGWGDAPHHPMIGRWAGDSVVVQGDYAEPDDPGFASDTKDYIDISADVADMLKTVFK